MRWRLTGSELGLAGEGNSPANPPGVGQGT